MTVSPLTAVDRQQSPGIAAGQLVVRLKLTGEADFFHSTRESADWGEGGGRLLPENQ